MITVSNAIADAISAELTDDGRRPVVIRNVPNFELSDTSEVFDVKAELGVSDETFVVLWQGGIGPSRMLEPVIEAFQYLPNAIFAIRTPYWEAFGKSYEELAARLGISDQIRPLDPVSSAQIVNSAQGADCGLWTLPNPCRNFHLALGNKIFEYLSAGLPIAVANYPEAKAVCEALDVGLAFDPADPKSIADTIRKFQNEPSRFAEMRRNAASAICRLGADVEWQKLVDLYADISNQHVAS